MTRRKASKLARRSAVNRQERIKKLLAAGWIRSEAEIPSGAIPADPDRVNPGGSYFPPRFYQDLAFLCVDCGASQVWQAEDQRWYYENTGAPCYSTAKRCRPCRGKERERKRLARIASGHAAPAA